MDYCHRRKEEKIEYLNSHYDDFEFICNTLFDPEVTKQEIKDLQDKYAISNDQALDILLKTAESIYIPAVNKAVNLFRESNSENDIIYSQPQLEAIFDFAYNTGERGVIVYGDKPEYITY